MDCTLMHKNIPVVDMKIDETGYIAKMGTVYDARRLPIGVHTYRTGVDRRDLNKWWLGRSIPASRDELDSALQNIGVASPAILIEKCYGLSLSDHYWVCPKTATLSWENVNFFQNEFSKDMGEILFGKEPHNLADINLMSPDNTSDGWLKKKWIIADGKRILMKGGSGPYRQEPFNEVVASAVMRRLDVPHVSYSVTMDGGVHYSLCENFLTVDMELIPAGRVVLTKKQPGDMSLYRHFVECCDALGVVGVSSSLDMMLTVDFIIANTDRHLNNFGLLRDVNTLEWLGFAPIYDSGSSLWYNTRNVGEEVKCKPFAKTHDEQIKLVSDLSWFELGALKGLDDEIVSIYAAASEVDAERGETITRNVMSRAERVVMLLSR